MLAQELTGTPGPKVDREMESQEQEITEVNREPREKHVWSSEGTYKTRHERKSRDGRKPRELKMLTFSKIICRWCLYGANQLLVLNGEIIYMYAMAMRHLSKYHSCCAIIAPPREQTDAHAVHQRKHL